MCISCGLTDDDFREAGKRFNESKHKIRCIRCYNWGRKYGWCKKGIHCLPPKHNDIFPPGLRTSTTRSYPICLCRADRGNPNPDYTDPRSRWPERIPIEDEDSPAFHYIAVKNRPEYKKRQKVLKEKRKKYKADLKRKKYQEDPEFREAVKRRVRERAADPEEKTHRRFRYKHSETAKEKGRETYRKNREQKLARKRENYKNMAPKEHRAFLDAQNEKRRKKKETK